MKSRVIMTGEELDELLELKKDIKTYDEYISKLQEKNDKWKRAWEAAEKRNGELERNLKSLRELQGLEVGEIMEREERVRKIAKEAPQPYKTYPYTKLLSQWMDNYNSWFERVTRVLDNDQKKG